MRIGLSQILWVVNGLLVPARQCQALAPSASPLGNSLAQFLHQAEASPCLVARRAAADLAFGASFSSYFLLADSSVSFHDQRCCSQGKCCLVSCIELGVGAWVILGGGTLSLSTALLPSKHPWGSLGGCRSQSCRGCLRALLRACGSRLVARPGITAHFGRHHLQDHLLAMSLILKLSLIQDAHYRTVV